MRLRARLGVAVAAAAAATWSAAPARAQAPPPSRNEVAAEALFEDARALVQAGKYAEACPKFADSERLGPSVATLLNLANCWEKLGRTATAWVTYRQAASAANASGRTDYLATALRHADGLALKLARLTIQVQAPVAGLQIQRDGVLVDSAEWGAPIPVDTGPHTVAATAAAHKPWSTSVDVAQDGTLTTVSVPSLEEAPAAPVAGPPVIVAPPPASAASAGTTTQPESGEGAGNTQRAVAVAIAAVGVVSLGVGGIIALGAKAIDKDSLGNCTTADPNLCNTAGLSQRNDARSAGDAASVLMGAGAAALVAGGIAWFTAPHARRAGRLQVLPTVGGLLARGTW
jgi:serine/threonine-protein kinase